MEEASGDLRDGPDEGQLPALAAVQSMSLSPSCARRLQVRLALRWRPLLIARAWRPRSTGAQHLHRPGPRCAQSPRCQQQEAGAGPDRQSRRSNRACSLHLQMRPAAGRVNGHPPRPVSLPGVGAQRLQWQLMRCTRRERPALAQHPAPAQAALSGQAEQGRWACQPWRNQWTRAWAAKQALDRGRS
eukprot:15446521-Alexandrium_andersonii.AAC.1